MRVSIKNSTGDFIGEVLDAGINHPGPFVQIEGYGGDAVLATATAAGSSTVWPGKTIVPNQPIENTWTDVKTTIGRLLAYRRRA